MLEVKVEQVVGAVKKGEETEFVSNDMAVLDSILIENEKKVADVNEMFVGLLEIKEAEMNLKKQKEFLKAQILEVLIENEEPMVVVDKVGEEYIVQARHKTTERFDKSGLANFLGIAIEDIQKPIDLVMLAKQGKLVPDDIKRFMLKDEKMIYHSKKMPKAKKMKK